MWRGGGGSSPAARSFSLGPRRRTAVQGGAKPRLQLGAAGGSWGRAGCSWKTNVAAAGQEPPRSYRLLHGLGRLIKAKMLKSKR